MSAQSVPRIVYGICGIGLGHYYRQLPILEHFRQLGAQITLFAYGKSLEALRQSFDHDPQIRIERVAVPYFVGDNAGLDFGASALRPENVGQDFLGINCAALDRTLKRVGRPDLVISDYEPVAAQYAYALNAPLVTIDQQSKFFARESWPELDGLSCQDEVMRLRMFFPWADARIATSFFRVPEMGTLRGAVEIHAPILRRSIIEMGAKNLTPQRSVLVYISSQRDFIQPLSDMVGVLSSQPSWKFDLFLPNEMLPGDLQPYSNVSIHGAGSELFMPALERCSAIISTAGHSLLSEAMYLAKPVFAVPLSVYEQRMNAEVIGSNGFGAVHSQVTPQNLREFLRCIADARQAIQRDENVLMREPGQRSIIRSLQGWVRDPALRIESPDVVFAPGRREHPRSALNP